MQLWRQCYWTLNYNPNLTSLLEYFYILHFSLTHLSSLFHFFLPSYFLQENYNTLLIKYAEAENTIDRMRLEAKVVHKEVGL